MENLIKILNIITAPIVSIILFYMASVKDSINKENRNFSLRNEKLYIPFYKMYYLFLCTDAPFSEQDTETRNNFLILLTDNVHLMSTKAQVLYFDFYNTYHQFYKNDGTRKTEYFIESEINITFNLLSSQLFKEYKDICKKLGLPKPAV